MDFAAGNGADTSHEGRQRSPEDFCAKDSTLPASIIRPSTEEPAAMLPRLAREYYMLSDIATNMRSGFILSRKAVWTWLLPMPPCAGCACKAFPYEITPITCWAGAYCSTILRWKG